MNITAKLAHETLKLIADINQTQPADGQETAPASSLDAMPVETLAALNHAGWMKLLMEQDGWRETDDKLQELLTNLNCHGGGICDAWGTAGAKGSDIGTSW